MNRVTKQIITTLGPQVRSKELHVDQALSPLHAYNEGNRFEVWAHKLGPLNEFMVNKPHYDIVYGQRAVDSKYGRLLWSLACVFLIWAALKVESMGPD